MATPLYLRRDAGLPDMGRSGAGPRAINGADVDAIMACADLAALAEMKGYARSYFAMSGLIVMAAGMSVGAALTGRTRVAAAAIGVATVAGLGVIEARRRARQWEAAIDARVAHIAR
ncbi:hypothetical protein [Demequina sp. NBRC 110051]|uniref:hypothetical protein n=1 Tax=Demequina sp. NBRC 110051 TaxID=1570340 RepID=UPI000A049B53|nr:hypothetical protein [Demequina sp. NBRC 110051]